MGFRAASTPESSLPRAYRPVVHYRDGALEAGRLPVIREFGLRVVANGVPLATLMCSEAALRELAYGFLFDEEVVDGADEIRSYGYDPATRTAHLEVARDVALPACPVRSSGFGGSALAAGECPRPVCGSGVARGPYPVAPAVEAVRRIQGLATEYAATRGMHCSALFRDGRPLACYEDVGRHNTLDKLAGHCLLNGIDPRGCLVATTGRVSGEMMRKALRLGAVAVASLSGPTDAAVGLAEEAGALLLGYVRDGAATGSERFRGAPEGVWFCARRARAQCAWDT